MFYKGVNTYDKHVSQVRTAKSVVDFVNTISLFDYDADIKYGRQIVDAKSILGVLYLAISRTVELVLHIDEDGCRDLRKKIAKFIV